MGRTTGIDANTPKTVQTPRCSVPRTDALSGGKDDEARDAVPGLATGVVRRPAYTS